MKILFISFLALNILFAGNYVVVTSQNSPITKLSKSAIKKIYLKKKLFYANQKLLPINLLAQDKIRMVFESRVLGMQREDINDYWIEQHYHGITPPITQKSYRSLSEFIKNVKGSIGYLSKRNVNKKMRVLYEF